MNFDAMSKADKMDIDINALQAKIAELEEKLAAAQKPKRLVLKVSEKGAVSLYGMGKFPVTLYSQQWERALDAADDIREFIKANAHMLSKRVAAIQE